MLTGGCCWCTLLQRTVRLNNDPRLLASVSKRKGYRTGMFCKWCLGSTAPSRTASPSTSTGSCLGAPGRGPELGASISFSMPASGEPTDLRFDEAFHTTGYSTD